MAWRNDWRLYADEAVVTVPRVGADGGAIALVREVAARIILVGGSTDAA